MSDWFGEKEVNAYYAERRRRVMEAIAAAPDVAPVADEPLQVPPEDTNNYRSMRLKGVSSAHEQEAYDFWDRGRVLAGAVGLVLRDARTEGINERTLAECERALAFWNSETTVQKEAKREWVPGKYAIRTLENPRRCGGVVNGLRCSLRAGHISACEPDAW